MIGVYAYSEPGKVLRYEDACIVAGSETAIKSYAASIPGVDVAKIRVSKLRFGEVRDGLDSGAAYAFDRRAYAGFYTLARQSGLDDLKGFPKDWGEGLDLMKVKCNT